MDKLAVVDPFVVVNWLLFYSKRTKAARKFRFWNMQFSALRVPRSIESRQINTTCLISWELWLLSLQELVHKVNVNDWYVVRCHFWGSFTWEKGKLVEQKEELHLVGVSLEPVGQWECHSLEIQVQHVLHLLFCSFNDFCFLIGLLSLSLVLRAVSYFKLVPLHSSSLFKSIFTASWVGQLDLNSWTVIFEMFSCQNVPKSTRSKGNLQQETNTQLTSCRLYVSR